MDRGPWWATKELDTTQQLNNKNKSSKQLVQAFQHLHTS